MKFLLLSLLSLAAGLAYARPAQQGSVEALAKRLSPPPKEQTLPHAPTSEDTTSEETTSEEQNRPDRPSSEGTTSEEQTLWASTSPYANQLGDALEKGSGNSFLGLDDEEFAQLADIFTDEEGFTAATRPAPKVDGLFDFPTASGDSVLLADLLDPGKDGYGFDAEITLDDKQVEGDKSNVKFGASPIKAGEPVFDPSYLESFDENGLPSVTFKPGDAVSAKISASLSAPSPDPRTDYSLFVPPYTQ